jgi:hypothetical protein
MTQDQHILDEVINGQTLSVWFIADDNYYEVYDQAGNCLTEGELMYTLPTKETLTNLTQL